MSLMKKRRYHILFGHSLTPLRTDLEKKRNIKLWNYSFKLAATNFTSSAFNPYAGLSSFGLSAACFEFPILSHVRAPKSNPCNWFASTRTSWPLLYCWLQSRQVLHSLVDWHRDRNPTWQALGRFRPSRPRHPGWIARCQMGSRQGTTKGVPNWIEFLTSG